MKSLLRLVFMTVCILVTSIVFSQTRIIWDDPQQVLTVAGESKLTELLAESEIEIATVLDYKKRCEYYYVEVSKTSNQAILNVFDCNRKMLGRKTWTGKFFSVAEESRAGMLAFAIEDIISNPSQVTGGDNGKGRQTDDLFSVPFNNHSTRYFFSPTSYNLKRGELYYSTVFFMVHDLQYGITDNFSLGMGTTTMLLPFYITPKYSFSAGKKNTFSVGTMFMLGTWQSDFIGNIGYVTYTHGTEFKNFTLGLGHLYVEYPENENIKIINEPLFNFSGMARISDHIYFVSENYVFRFSDNITGYYGTNPDPWGGFDFKQDLTRQSAMFAGMSGFRFVNRKKDVIAFQFGLAYMVKFRPDLSSEYNSANWYLEYNSGKWKRLVLPTFTFYKKFGKRV